MGKHIPPSASTAKQYPAGQTKRAVEARLASQALTQTAKAAKPAACAELRYDRLEGGDYDRAKAVFNAARHPGFIGRELFFRCATKGNATIAVVDGVDAGVALVAQEKLLALSVSRSFQGRGIGAALLRKLHPQWVSAIADKVEWFEKQGYAPKGAMAVGKNGKQAVQLMERSSDAPSNEVAVAAAKPATTPEQTNEVAPFIAQAVARSFAAPGAVMVVGAPTKLTPATFEAIVDSLARGNCLETAAAAIGVNTGTLQRWLKRGEETGEEPYAGFCVAVVQARAQAEQRAVAAVRAAIEGTPQTPPSWQAAAFYLERSHPERWGRVDRNKVLVTTQALPDGLDPSKLSTEDIEALARIYERAGVPLDTEQPRKALNQAGMLASGGVG